MRKEEVIEWKMQSDMRRRLNGIAGSFQKLSKSVTSFAEPEGAHEERMLPEILEEVSFQVCRDCAECSRCWEKEKQKSYTAMQKLVAIVQTGEIKEEGYSEFLEQCQYGGRLIEELHRSVFRARQSMLWRSRLNESREAVAGQLSEMARIVGEFAGNLEQKGKRAWYLPGTMYAKLWLRQIKARQMLLLELEDGSVELHMTARCRKGRCMTTKEAALLLSNMLGEKLVPGEDSRNVIGREYAEYVFREDANFQVLTGVARAARVDSRISGDNFSFLYPEGDEFIMLLSDGMGSGEAACRESELVIELLEQFLEAGFKEEAAMKLINSMLVLRTENNMFSTMDICVLHLATGMCDFMKAGAAATYILRENWMESICSDNLPAGMLSCISCETKKKKLYHGDYIIMLSDGVLDGNVGEEFLREVLLEMKSSNPQELANAILDAAMVREGYQPKDDMTVLVAGVFRRGM